MDTEKDTFDIGALDARDEATLNIKHPTTDKETGWIWTFYGPGHPITIELADQVGREQLRLAREKEQARVNGKKWKADDESIDALRKRNVDSIVKRTRTFTSVSIDGKLIEFSPDNARMLLSDQRKGWLFKQVTDYLREDESFIRPSATS
ncbi:MULTISPECIES: branched-chain amino acid ABC transporter [unclassified Bradyrhizobium]